MNETSKPRHRGATCRQATRRDALKAGSLSLLGSLFGVLVMLVASFILLFAINRLQRWSEAYRRPM